MDLTDRIIAKISTLPEIEAWPTLIELVHHGKSLDWQIPIMVAMSLGNTQDSALPAAAALACLQVSIIVVDDMLDNDPRGGFHTYGIGRTANFALALQACGNRLIHEADLPDDVTSRAQDQFAQIALHTAFGQQLDSENLRGEENYWRVVRTKSTPFYSGAFKLGAIFAESTGEIADGFFNLGQLMGELSQIEDDIEDALDSKLNADWGEGRNNLMIMYAELADHDDREEFTSLRANIEAPGALARAQQILLNSGALSYAIYLAAQKYADAEHTLAELALPYPAQIEQHLNDYLHAFNRYVELAGINSIKDLL